MVPQKEQSWDAKAYSEINQLCYNIKYPIMMNYETNNGASKVNVGP